MKQLLSLILSVLVCYQLHAEPFKFVALGDTAYGGAAVKAKYHELIDLINQAKPAFSIHIGDLWGAAICNEERYLEEFERFERFEQPVFFTPGDNEWTDCNRYAYGNYENVSRLELIRDIFFADATSLGANPMSMVRQADISQFIDYVENARWLYEDVLFLTLNVAGSFNNLQIKHERSIQEAFERHKANIAWLRDSFRIARENDLPAVVLSMHAEILDASTADDYLPGEFDDLVSEIQLAAYRFGKPVLLIHGDFHKFIIDRPFLESREPGRYGNITRLQVYGDPDIRGVQVGVDTSKKWVFSYEPIYVE
ncbi:MAG: metallophosphoesterase [Gammaproteobacteria bacterium]|nr:metallophosphoesterase [Gammaproteobacteria bacterium]